MKIERKFQAALLINSDLNQENIDSAQQKLEEVRIIVKTYCCTIKLLINCIRFHLR